MQYLQTMLMSAAAVLICLSFHEAAHAFAAYVLGDTTAKDRGRMTLNPVSHIDPIGFMALLFFHFGWAKPVPINYRNLKKPKLYSAIIALAGPVSNFLLAIVLYTVAYGMIMFNYNELTYALAQFLNTTAIISVGLGVFNLIPIPPLDGSHILIPLLPRKQQLFMIQNAQFIQFALIIGLCFNILNLPLYFLRNIATSGIFVIVNAILSLLPF
ncbi:MAG: site-2 protease family protein [Clostridia bacterium]